jgi:hypothetical protein
MPLKRSFRQCFAAALIMGMLTPLLILAHALGHYVVARYLGYEPRLRHAEVFIPADPPVSDADWISITLAGPVVILFFAVAGVWWLLHNRSSPLKEHDASLWVFTAFALAGFRWLKIIFEGRSSDEAYLSAIWGFHHSTGPYLLLPLCLLSAIAVLAFHIRQKTMVPLAVGVLAAMVSSAVWFYLVGPVVLP